jgi:enoyl-CoA hydratase/carnithine racemase
VAQPSLVRFDQLHGGAVLRITLAAPPLNALDAAMSRAIIDVLDREGDLPQRKLILFRADGPNFSAERADGPDDPLADRVGPLAAALGRAGLHDLLRRLIALGVPTASLVHGSCHGHGLALAAFTNFVFASADATFCLETAAAWPLTASLILPLKLGYGHADDLVLAGERLAAGEAYRRGLVVAWARPGESLDALAEAWLSAHVASRSAPSLRRANRVARLQFHVQLERDLALLDSLTGPAAGAPLQPPARARSSRPSAGARESAAARR